MLCTASTYLHMYVCRSSPRLASPGNVHSPAPYAVYLIHVRASFSRPHTGTYSSTLQHAAGMLCWSHFVRPAPQTAVGCPYVAFYSAYSGPLPAALTSSHRPARARRIANSPIAAHRVAAAEQWDGEWDERWQTLLFVHSKLAYEVLLFSTPMVLQHCATLYGNEQLAA